MSERYWISGVQLGMLIVLPTETERKKMVDEITEKQFVGNTDTYEPLPYKKLCRICKCYDDTWTINDFCPKCQEKLLQSGGKIM
jgi:hypothetical protein